MMKYNEWKLLTESVMPSFNLGLSSNPTIGGLMGAQFQEVGFGSKFDDEEEDEFDDEEDEFDDEEEFGDEDLEDDEFGDDEFGDDEFGDDEFGDDDLEGDDLGDGDLEGDLLGAGEEDGIMGSEEGPEKSFPPDDSEEMEPSDDEMDGILGDIDPELAGLGGDEMGDDMGDELGDEMGDDMGDELGDELGGDMGDELGDELGGDMGDELGDMGEPCPDCNPDGMGEGDPSCEICGGEGFMPDEEGFGEIDAEMQDPEEAQKAEFMRMMKHYQTKFMSKDSDCGKMMKHHKHHTKKENVLHVEKAEYGSYGKTNLKSAPDGCVGKSTKDVADSGEYLSKSADKAAWKKSISGKKHMSSCGGKKYMDKDDVKPRDIDKNGKIDGWEVGRAMGLKKALGEKENKKHMSGKCCENFVGSVEETQDDFLANLSRNARGEVRKKFESGISAQYEDALFSPIDPESLEVGVRPEPDAGDFGFAPQGRVGAIGGGYTQADVSDIPTMEGRKYMSLDQYISKKKRT